MKTSEEKLNEALRSALKRKFDHFEDAPDPSAFEKIRANLKPARQWKYLFFTILFTSIAIVGVMTDQHYRKNNKAAAKIAAPVVAKTAVATTQFAQTKIARLTAAKTAVARTEVAKIGVAKTAVAKTTVAQAAVAQTAVTHAAVAQTEITKAGMAKTNIAKEAVSKTEIDNIEQRPITEQSYIIDEPADQYKAGTASQNEAGFSMTELDNQPAKFTTAPVHLPGITVVQAETASVAKNEASAMKLLLNASILQSYQILTVPSGAQSFQNFEFPSTFSSKALGYKISIGAEKKGFQFLLHYSWFQQSYSYEIAGNDYIVETVDKDNFKVIRKGTRVSQDNKFRLLGIGVNKEVTWGNAHVGKYYASAGLQYSYGLIRRQSIGWVNAGIGKQFPISRKNTLHIGPYAEFSPVKFSGSVDPFYYQPYRIGISAGLRLNR